MYAAKRHGAGFEYYDVVDDQHTVRRLGMLSELRAAIDNGGIALHYQPQMNLKTGGVDERRGAGSLAPSDVRQRESRPSS